MQSINTVLDSQASKLAPRRPPRDVHPRWRRVECISHLISVFFCFPHRSPPASLTGSSVVFTAGSEEVFSILFFSLLHMDCIQIRLTPPSAGVRFFLASPALFAVSPSFVVLPHVCGCLFCPLLFSFPVRNLPSLTFPCKPLLPLSPSLHIVCVPSSSTSSVSFFIFSVSR